MDSLRDYASSFPEDLDSSSPDFDVTNFDDRSSDVNRESRLKQPQADEDSASMSDRAMTDTPRVPKNDNAQHSAGTNGSGSDHEAIDAAGLSQDAVSPAAPDSGEQPTSTEAVTASRRRKLQQIHLKTDGLSVPKSYPDAMHSTFSELAAINYRNFPTATMDLLRTVLEKTVKAYAEARGHTIRAELHRRGTPITGNFEQLGDCLNYLEAILVEEKNNKIVQVLRKIKSSKPEAWTVSSTHLNAVNHNHHIAASPSDVEQMWAQMSSLIYFMLDS